MGTAALLDEETGPTTRRITWHLTQADPDGAWLRLPDYPDKSVHIAGNFDGATVKIEGSSRADKADPVTLTDTQGAIVSKTQAAAVQLTENVEYIRPVSTGGGAGQALTVTAVCRGTRR